MLGHEMNDDEILEIKSPRARLKGPYEIVAKDEKERWAIVTLHWDKSPALGMRWFWDKKGNPVSRGYPTWFILPKSLHKNLLLGLNLKNEILESIESFLNSPDLD